MKRFIALGLILLGFVPSLLQASPEMDSRYAFRRLASLHLQWNQEPVYGAALEKAMREEWGRYGRFEYSEAGFQKGLEGLKTIESSSLISVLAEMRSAETDSAVVVEWKQPKDGEKQYQASLTSAFDGKVIARVTGELKDATRLEEYQILGREIVRNLIRQLPFEATVLRREGYRVVLDAGITRYRKGQRLSAFTFESGPNGVSFEETGTLIVVEPGKEIAFAQVLAERYPRTVGEGNKIRPTRSALPAEVLSRNIAVDVPSSNFLQATAPRPMFRSALGNVEVSFGPSLFYNRHYLPDSSLALDTARPLMGGTIQTEILLTTKFFFEGAYGYYTSTPISGALIASGVSELRGMVGYRHRFNDEMDGPSVHFKLGFLSRSFNNSDTEGTLFYTSTKHSGIAAGGGGRLPIDRIWTLGLDVTTLMLSGFSESPVTSGAAVDKKTGWQIQSKVSLQVRPDMDVSLRGVFEHWSADFSGQGTRSVAVSSITQTSIAGLLGLAYFF